MWKRWWSGDERFYGFWNMAARGQGFSQLFAASNQLAKDRESSNEDVLGDFYGLLSDLLELTAGLRRRNSAIRTLQRNFRRLPAR